MTHATYESLRVYWVPTIANIAAPTVAEIGAGTNLTDYVPVEGVNTDMTENEVTTAMLGDSFIVSDPGTWSARNEVTFMRHITATDDDAWTLFVTNQIGNFVIARFAAAAAAARVEVYPARSGRRRMQASAENTHQRFLVTLYGTDTPNFDAVVAA
jgi:Tfp pilus assembly protein FimT